MRAIEECRDDSNSSFGQRPNRQDLGRFSLDLSWARTRADSGSSAVARGYPSPPMSGSPSLPPNGPQEFARPSPASQQGQGGHQGGQTGQGRQGSYQAQSTVQDVRHGHGIPAIQGDTRMQQQQASVMAAPSPRQLYTAETNAQERMQHAWPRPEPTSPRALPYPHLGQSHNNPGQTEGQSQHMPHHYPQQQQQLQQPQRHPQQVQLSYLPAPSSGLGNMGSAPPPAYAGPSSTAATAIARPSSLEQMREGPTQTSPKLQRKTKGHVASACVPCKRAHLRCDAQRPCSRCTSNGKEDACVDVQHKKRGRPRLRDDRESRYDPRFGSYSETHTPIMRRPMSVSGYGSAIAAGAAFEEGIRRNQSQPYRVLKSNPPEPPAPRFIGRASATDANIFPAPPQPQPQPPLSIYTKPPEPAAFLTTDLEIAKASSTFLEALARHDVIGMKLVDIITPSDREKVLGHQRQLHEEQRRRDPTYLPPIFGKQEEERVIQALGFGADEVARFPMDREDFLTFVTQDGQQRVYPVRIGLAKQDSIYFVVVRLWMAVRGGFPPPTPSPNPRDVSTPSAFYQPISQSYMQQTPVSATFDPRQRLGGESAFGHGQRPFQRAGPGPTPSSQQMMQGLSPGLPTPYAPSSNRQDFSMAQSQYQGPRSDETASTTTTATMTSSRPPSISSYHLPPILGHQQSASTPALEMQQSYNPTAQSYQARDDNSRVGIGGLIDRPNPSSRPL